MYINAKRFLVKHSTQEKFYWLEQNIMQIDNNGLIVNFIPKNEFNGTIDIDYAEYDIAPGLIDLHIHGCNGFDSMEANQKEFNSMSLFLAKKGVVAFQATTVTNIKDKIYQALTRIKKNIQTQPLGAKIIGTYLEGPYFTAGHRGAHPINLLQDIKLKDLEELLDNFKDIITCIGLAPEKENAIEAIKYLKSQNIKVMLGHSSANYQQAIAAFNAGADGIIHCYNGMQPLHHREPSLLGAGLTTNNAYVEIICDGFHVHPAAVDIAYRCTKDQQRMYLITDAMEATGMPDGNYRLGEYIVTMKDGVVRTDEGSLAGSTLTLNQAVFNLQKWLNLSLEEAWFHASYIPAKSANLKNLGSLEKNKFASFVVLEKQNIIATWVEGKKVNFS